MNLRISFASDHAGFEFKEKLIAHFISNFNTVDRGAFSAEQSDYPDYAIHVVDDIKTCYSTYGVLICGTGIGMSIMANRFPEIRACNPITIDQTRLAREHNNANVICFGARLSTFDEMIQMLEVFFNTPFASGRHEERVKKLTSYYNLMNRFVEEF